MEFKVPLPRPRTQVPKPSAPTAKSTDGGPLLMSQTTLWEKAHQVLFPDKEAVFWKDLAILPATQRPKWSVHRMVFGQMSNTSYKTPSDKRQNAINRELKKLEDDQVDQVESESDESNYTSDDEQEDQDVQDRRNRIVRNLEHKFWISAPKPLSFDNSVPVKRQRNVRVAGANKMSAHDPKMAKRRQKSCALQILNTPTPPERRLIYDIKSLDQPVFTPSPLPRQLERQSASFPTFSSWTFQDVLDVGKGYSLHQNTGRPLSRHVKGILRRSQQELHGVEEIEEDDDNDSSSLGVRLRNSTQTLEAANMLLCVLKFNGHLIRAFSLTETSGTTHMGPVFVPTEDVIPMFMSPHDLNGIDECRRKQIPGFLRQEFFDTANEKTAESTRARETNPWLVHLQWDKDTWLWAFTRQGMEKFIGMSVLHWGKLGTEAYKWWFQRFPEVLDLGGGEQSATDLDDDGDVNMKI